MCEFPLFNSFQTDGNRYQGKFDSNRPVGDGYFTFLTSASAQFGTFVRGVWEGKEFQEIDT